MRQYKISIHDRDYSEWTIVDAHTHEEIYLDINPTGCKLFNGDVFGYENSECIILYSIVRNSVQIPGVLLLDNNIYGKQKNKYIYKCVPDDKHLPIFMVAHEEKNMGFSKRKVNKYITFQYKQWNSPHPDAIIKNNIGNVEELNHFYEYQLFCKSLNASIQGFGKDARKSINKINTNKTFDEMIVTHKIQRRENVYIFSIDGNNTQDFDDAFSVQELEDHAILSVYITNVAVWLDVLNLWDSFSERISSIYLPDRKRPMLPTILSNILCSLYKDQTRVAVAMDIYIKDESIIDVKYSNVCIEVSENYVYDNIDNNNVHYNLVEKYTKYIFEKYKLIKNIENSKDLVAFLMLFMNYHTSTILKENNCGIFRSITSSESSVPRNISKPLYKFMKLWNSSSGQYTTEHKHHDLLEIESYIHITSPMRRLVDLLNIIKIQEVLKLYTFTREADLFYTKWVERLDYINTTTRSIRKIQFDCNLLHWCNGKSDLTTLLYDGFVFDKMRRSDGLYQYVVFIDSINMASRITIRNELENYSKHKFSLHIFNKKESFKKKVRVHLHDDLS
jgi:exoribonuclease R